MKEIIFEVLKNKKEVASSSITLGILWLAMLYLPLSKVENPYTYVTLFWADLSGKLSDDNNLIAMLIFHAPIITIGIVTIIHIMYFFDWGASLKTLKLIVWLPLLVNLFYLKYSYSLITNDKLPFTVANILVPILVFIYIVLIFFLKQKKDNKSSIQDSTTIESNKYVPPVPNVSITEHMPKNLNKNYFLFEGGNQTGPFAITDLKDKVNFETLIWHEGMPEWKKVHEIQDLYNYLNEKIK